MINKIRRFLFSEKHDGKVFTVGLKREKNTKKDERDIKIGLSLFGYTPLSKVSNNQNLSVKNQHYNTCGQESLTGATECYKKKILSEQSQTCFMKVGGFISQDGFSSLRDNMMSLIKNGIADGNILHDDDFEMSFDDYASATHLTKEIRDNAILNKVSNFASVIGRNARLKALDGGKVLYTGIDWYSGYNMGGGFNVPWIVSKIIGWLCGGHAIYILNYDIPRNVYIVMNSYSTTWGGYVDSNGKQWPGAFGIDMDFFDKEGYATYILINLEQHLDEIVKQYEGKQVKASGSPAIYKIEGGVKRGYPDAMTFYADGGFYGQWGTSYTLIAGSVLNAISEGSQMTMEETKNFTFLKDNLPMLKTLSEPENLKKMQEIIKNATPYSFNPLSMIKGKFGVLSSSINPEALSLTVKGFLTTALPIVIMIANLKGIVIDTDQANSVISFVYDFILYGATFVGMIITAWGAIRRYYQAMKNK